MLLADAHKVATHVLRLVQPWCERAVIAGSIRRESPEVGDVEIVCIPSYADFQKEGSMLPGDTEKVNVLYNAIAHTEFIQWLKPGQPEAVLWAIRPDGKYWRGLIRKGAFDAPADIKLDMFLAQPANWGIILTIRTGPADFSRALVTHARDNTDYRVEGGYLMLQGGQVPCPDERVVFDALRLKYIEPTARKSDRDVRPVWSD